MQRKRKMRALREVGTEMPAEGAGVFIFVAAAIYWLLVLFLLLWLERRLYALRERVSELERERKLGEQAWSDERR